MPGVPGSGPESLGSERPREVLALALEERLSRVLGELRQEVEGSRVAAERQAEEARQAIEPVARAVRELQDETATLRRQLERLSCQLEALSLWLEQSDPSSLLLAAEDPNALFQGGLEPALVAHPPTFSTRRQSSLHLSRSNSLMDPEPEEPPAVEETEVANGTEKGRPAKEPDTRGKLSSKELNAIEDESILDKMLDQTTDFEERRLIRAALRELRQKKRDGGGSSSFVQTKSFSSSSKKMGSIFDREDNSPSRAGSLAALERRQAEKKKELMKAQSLPKTSASQARKAMIEKLEKESGSPAGPRVTVQRSTSFGVPNANSIKQMLLDWCRAKTRGYEHVDIQNFSSSWSDGMAFCALVHNFFPEAFDYAQLTPQNRRQNFEVAFSSAETHADCPQLLDTEDMVRMREPDWKCVYTYIQEFYRCLVQKGLVKTKKS
uniref:Smoothelin n=1 Tax=Ornithorhynchus anatinus TaxID=9258 RepID=K7EB70_ORNAN